MRSVRDKLNSVRDYLLLSALLVGINWLVAREDLGWLQINPTPWILPPMLVGARYGFIAGLVSGLVTAALIVAANFGGSEPALHHFVSEHAYLLLSVVITGVLAGEWKAIVLQKLTSLEAAREESMGETSRLKIQLEVDKERRHALQRQLALYNAPLASLDVELELLLGAPAEDFATAMLGTLHQLTGLTSAGIYLHQGRHLQRVTVLHPTEPLVETLVLADTPLAERALAENELASVPDATTLTMEQPFLAAIPWIDEQGRSAVLLIQDMPYESYSLHQLARIELILSWVSVITQYRKVTQDNLATSQGLVSQEEFMFALDKSLQNERFHGFPSAVMKIAPHDEAQTGKVLSLVPLTAVSTRLDDGRALATLLPLSGSTEAGHISQSLESMMPGLNAHYHLITEAYTPESLWEQLNAA